MWAAATQRGRTVPAQVWIPGGRSEVPASLHGVAFSQLRDPFAPLIGIWHLGYALDTVANDTIVLVAPEVHDDESPRC